MGQRHEKTKRRLTAMWLKQGGRCIYCEVVVPLAFVSSRPPGMTTTSWSQIKGTVEHIHRKTDGGRDVTSNRLMACAYCNHSREDAEPMAHKREMMTRRAHGTHPASNSKLFEKTIYAMVKGGLQQRRRNRNIGARSDLLHAQAHQGAGPDNRPG